MTREELARDVIACLDGQRDYFREKHPDEKQRLLVLSKSRESRLRKTCEEILDGTAANLFDVGGSD